MKISIKLLLGVVAAVCAIQYVNGDVYDDITSKLDADCARPYGDFININVSITLSVNQLLTTLLGLVDAILSLVSYLLTSIVSRLTADLLGILNPCITACNSLIGLVNGELKIILQGVVSALTLLLDSVTITLQRLTRSVANFLEHLDVLRLLANLGRCAQRLLNILPTTVFTAVQVAITGVIDAIHNLVYSCKTAQTITVQEGLARTLATAVQALAAAVAILLTTLEANLEALFRCLNT